METALPRGAEGSRAYRIRSLPEHRVRRVVMVSQRPKRCLVFRGPPLARGHSFGSAASGHHRNLIRIPIPTGALA